VLASPPRVAARFWLLAATVAARFCPPKAVGPEGR
jgi:hypothetical protein